MVVAGEACTPQYKLVVCDLINKSVKEVKRRFVPRCKILMLLKRNSVHMLDRIWRQRGKGHR